MTSYIRRCAVLGMVLLGVLIVACGNNGGDGDTAVVPDARTEAAGAGETTDAAGDQALTAKAGTTRSAKDIKWFHYEEGVSRAKNYGKKVFVNFYADWCAYCKQMERTTFEDKRVIAYLNDNFIPVRVDSDKKPKRAAEFGVRGLPVSWFLTETGERIGNQPGYLPADTLLPLLKFIHTDAYERMGFNEFMKQM